MSTQNSLNVSLKPDQFLTRCYFKVILKYFVCILIMKQRGNFLEKTLYVPPQIFVIKYWGLPIDNPQYPNIL